MIALISTQVYENYGTTTDPFWKAKGGDDIKVTDLPDTFNLEEIIETAKATFDIDNTMFREHVIGVALKNVNYITEFESSQLEYDGEIKYPAKKLSYDELLDLSQQ